MTDFDSIIILGLSETTITKQVEQENFRALIIKWHPNYHQNDPDELNNMLIGEQEK